MRRDADVEMSTAILADCCRYAAMATAIGSTLLLFSGAFHYVSSQLQDCSFAHSLGGNSLCAG